MQFIIAEPGNKNSQLKTPHSLFITLIKKSQQSKTKICFSHMLKTTQTILKTPKRF